MAHAGSSSAPASALYELAESVPLIKSPSLRIPARPELPVAELHPLPPSLEPYFVYDFHLEDYVLKTAPASGFQQQQQQLQVHSLNLVALLQRPPSSGIAGEQNTSTASSPLERLAALRAIRARSEQLLMDKKLAERKREEQRLRQVAPGWKPDGPTLVPDQAVRKQTLPSPQAPGADGNVGEKNGTQKDQQQEAKEGKRKDSMEEMLDRLEAMDAGRK